MKKMVKKWSDLVSNYKDENERMVKELHGVRSEYYKAIDELNKLKTEHYQMQQ